ncbi:MAG TPA: AAA family ATPase [Nitriliruptorales bacterium]|nr:AAA family ATPase [Nitriliruptorales bacterium]
MKLGVVGKGGSGKTTVAALLVQAYTERGARVLAVDTDANPNLALSLGLDLAEADRVPVLPRSLIVGEGDGATPPADLVDRYGVSTPAGAILVHAMSVNRAAAGCMCSGHASVRSLLGAAIDGEADVTIVDMEAGLEHLSRSGGTLAYADVLLAVVEPTRKSIRAAARIRALAEDLGIPRIYAVGNKARRPDDATLFVAAQHDHGLPLAAVLPYEHEVVDAERAGTMLSPEQAPAARQAVAELIDLLASTDEERAGLRRRVATLERQLAELQSR